MKEDCKNNPSRQGITSRIDELADQIVETFPKEKKSRYYIPFNSIKHNGKVVKKHHPKGKLYFKYTNYLKTLTEEGIRCTSSQSVDASNKLGKIFFINFHSFFISFYSFAINDDVF